MAAIIYTDKWRQKVPMNFQLYINQTTRRHVSENYNICRNCS